MPMGFTPELPSCGEMPRLWERVKDNLENELTVES